MSEATMMEPEERQQTCANMLAVASGKGRVGKTWLSVTLAQALARSGTRVLLFDGDLGLANVDLQLALQPRTDLGGVLEGSYPLKSAVAPSPGAGLRVTPGHFGPVTPPHPP